MAKTAGMTGDEKLVLSGSALSKIIIDNVLEISGIEAPNILLDGSPRHNQLALEKSQAMMAEFFDRFKVSNASWLEPTFKSGISPEAAQEKLAEADILWVSGGSTRLAYHRWQELGISETIRSRIADGSLVGCGGSAGAMIWFARGYSDSRQYEVAEGNRWNYVLVPGVANTGSWVTAHYSDVDDFGRLRSAGFERTLKRYSDEWSQAIGLEKYAALICANGVARSIDVRSKPDTPPHTTYIYERATERWGHALEAGETIELI